MCWASHLLFHSLAFPRLDLPQGFPCFEHLHALVGQFLVVLLTSLGKELHNLPPSCHPHSHSTSLVGHEVQPCVCPCLSCLCHFLLTGRLLDHHLFRSSWPANRASWHKNTPLVLLQVLHVVPTLIQKRPNFSQPLHLVLGELLPSFQVLVFSLPIVLQWLHTTSRASASL